MTEAKPAEFAKGDQVTSKDGTKLVVINQGSPGGAVLCETASGVKPYDSTYYAADTLKKAAKKSPAKPKDAPPAEDDYIVTFKTGDDLTYGVAVEGASSDDDALAQAITDDSHTEGDEVVSVEKVTA